MISIKIIIISIIVITIIIMCLTIMMIKVMIIIIITMIIIIITIIIIIIIMMMTIAIHTINVRGYIPLIIIIIILYTLQGTLLGDQPDLRKMEEILKKTNYNKLKFIKKKSYNMNCNWKVFIDNYLGNLLQKRSFIYFTTIKYFFCLFVYRLSSYIYCDNSLIHLSFLLHTSFCHLFPLHPSNSMIPHDTSISL